MIDVILQKTQAVRILEEILIIISPDFMSQDQALNFLYDFLLRARVSQEFPYDLRTFLLMGSNKTLVAEIEM